MSFRNIQGEGSTLEARHQDLMARVQSAVSTGLVPVQWLKEGNYEVACRVSPRTDVKPATSIEYGADKGQCCPVCGSDWLVGNSWTVNGYEATQEVCCRRCYSSWLDTYTRTGYDRLCLPEQETP